MFRALAFAFTLAFGVSASPLTYSEKEIPSRPSLIVVAHADVVPCPDEPIIVKLAPITVEAKAPVKPKPKAKVKAKVKKKTVAQLKAEKAKKKYAAVTGTSKAKPKPDKHKSKVPDHHKSKVPNPSTNGPLHLTGPPGCG